MGHTHIMRAFFVAAAVSVCSTFIAAPPALAQQQTAVSVQRGYLGVELRDLTKKEAKALGWPTRRGTVVRNVVPVSPAATAKLFRGDIVVSVNNRPITDTAHFLNTIGGKAPGVKISLQVVRRGKLRSRPVTLGAKPDEPSASGTPQGEGKLVAAVREEFLRLHKQWQGASTPETQIAAIEPLLRLVPQTTPWPLPMLRDELRATLHDRLARAYIDRREGGRAENLEKALAASDAGLTMSSRDQTPERWAAAQLSHGMVLAERIRGNRADNQERAVAAFEQALTVYTREAFPQRWAEVQHQLGDVLRNRKLSDQQDNLARSISAFEAALTVRTRDAAPLDWAATQHGLGISYRMSTRGDRAENIERALTLFEAVLTVRTRESAPREWATTQHHLAIAHRLRLRGDKAENKERAIAIYEGVLTVRTREAMPEDWAMTQQSLGFIYIFRTKGDKAENIERAIAYLEAALTVRTREAFPEDWATIQTYLAYAYESRVRGDKAENMERIVAAYEAALTVFTSDAYPRDCSATRHYLGVAYEDRIRGDKAENIERAIGEFEAAVSVRAKEKSRNNWANSQSRLASLYRSRKRGDAAENIERAIAGYESVLDVYTREKYPDDWANTQMFIGVAYFDRNRGNPSENVERSITALEAAVTVHTRQKSPLAWSTTQLYLAKLYLKRPHGERAENAERAIAACEAALSYFPPNTPDLWELRINLGIAYYARIHGDRMENIERAIAIFDGVLTTNTRTAFPDAWATGKALLASAYTLRKRGTAEENTKRAVTALDEALTVHTREKNPVAWARVQSFLGFIYAVRDDGDRKENLKQATTAIEASLTVLNREQHSVDWALARQWLGTALADERHGGDAQNLDRAITATRDALSVFTREVFPVKHSQAARNLGMFYLMKHDWRSADEILASAREAFLVTFGEGMNETDARNVVGGDLFTIAAYAAVQLGEPERAFALLDEGKARLLGVALKLNALDISPQEQERLQELRREIRRGEATYETLKGEEKAEKVTELGRLRAEVLAQVKKGSPATTQADFLARVADAVPEGGALVAPIYLDNDSGSGLRAVLLVATVKDGRAHIRTVETPEGNQEIKASAVEAFKDWAEIYKLDTLPAAERETALRKFYSGLKKIGPVLWLAMGEPLADALDKEGVKPGAPVVLLPVGVLGVIPFSLAQNPANGRMFMDDYPVAYAPSISALVSAKERARHAPAIPSLTAIVNPTSDLPFTPVETALVSSRFEAGRRIIVAQEAATPEATLVALQGTDYWHFASHGFFNWDDAMNSGLLLAGKKPLTVGALMRAEGLKGPRLAVLSACETGVYDFKRKANEFTGLPSAFLQLGTGGVVSSLWPVDDLSTALLIAKFYDLHRNERLPPVHALRDAQIWLRNVTAGELHIYAQQAVREGRLQRETGEKLRIAMARNTASRGLIESLAALINGSEPPAIQDDARAKERPFAHPYYWSGFILTGL